MTISVLLIVVCVGTRVRPIHFDVDVAGVNESRMQRDIPFFIEIITKFSNRLLTRTHLKF